MNAESPELSALLDEMGLVCYCSPDMYPKGFHADDCAARLRAQAEEVMQRVMDRISKLEEFIDDNTGWLGGGPNDREEYYCEFCHAHHADCCLIEHEPTCKRTLILNADQASRQPEVKK